MRGASAEANAREPEFRPDIQGLRAVAVLFVLAFHVFPAALPGGFVGVDIFFVISGFLITGLLLKELEATGSIDLGAFYVRRIRRLLPAASLVLVTVALGMIFALPMLRWKDTAYHVLGSALYVENWLLLRNAVDYWQQDAPQSPVMHYWSLSIEEQFYFVWPCLLLLCAGMARASKLHLRPTLVVVGCVIFAASLAYSVSYSASSAAAAYFSSATRAWELALGALASLAHRHLSPRLAPLSRTLGWLGIAGVVASGFVIDETLPFPGWVALLPTTSTALLLSARSEAGKFSHGSWLAARPLQFVGDLSYSLYLWHWPPVVFFVARYDRPPNLGEGLLIVLAAFALAYVTKLIVEDPFRRGFARRKIGGLSLAALCLAGSAAAVAFPLLRVGEFERAARDGAMAKGALAFLDARALRVEPSLTAPTFVPSAMDAKHDLPALVRDGCHLRTQTAEPKLCRFGNERAPIHLVLTGDSHAFQWVPSLMALADSHDLRVTSITKTSCPMTDVELLVGSKAKRPYTECVEWNRALLPTIEGLRPSLVLTSQASGYELRGVTDQAQSDRMLADGSRRVWERLASSGIKVVLIRDTPTIGFDVAECLARKPSSIEACAVPRFKALDPDDALVRAANMSGSAELLDLSDFICGPEECPAVVGGVLVYRDSHHLTATYARTLAPLLWPRLAKFLRFPP